MKKIKKQNNQFFRLGVVGGILFLSVVGYFVAMSKSSNTSNSAIMQKETKTYQSKNMHFSIQINSDFQTKDSDSSVYLISSNRQIAIVRNGTNFNDLDSYISNFDSKRKLVSTNSTKLTIDGYEGLSRIVRFTEESMEQKSYYIYVNNYVYILSTFSPILYSDLDKIAQSFRYTP